MLKLVNLAVLAFAFSGSAFAQSIQDAPLPAAISLEMDHGQPKFVDDEGRSLYVFDRDPAGHSVCDNQCATNWPPVAASAGAHQIGQWTPVQRSDGTLQWAYKGKPVYRFRGDTAPGQTNGAGVGGAWRLVVP